MKIFNDYLNRLTVFDKVKFDEAETRTTGPSTFQDELIMVVLRRPDFKLNDVENMVYDFIKV